MNFNLMNTARGFAAMIVISVIMYGWTDNDAKSLN